MYLPAGLKQAEVDFFVWEERGPGPEGCARGGSFRCDATGWGENVGIYLGADLSW